MINISPPHIGGFNQTRRIYNGKRIVGTIKKIKKQAKYIMSCLYQPIERFGANFYRLIMYALIKDIDMVIEREEKE